MIHPRTLPGNSPRNPLDQPDRPATRNATASAGVTCSVAVAPPAEVCTDAAKPELAFNEDRWRAEQLDRRRLRQAVAVAFVLHLGLLVVHLPSLAEPPLVPPEPPKVYVLAEPRFEPPKPPLREIPQRRSTRMPMPDPDPEVPEVRPVEAAEFEIDVRDVDVLVLPSKPPPEATAPTGPIHLTAGIEKPRKIYGPAPTYTEMARRVRREGAVILRTVIDELGNVEQVEVVRGLSFGLTEAAVDAVQQWRFEPATLNGKPVAVYYHLTVHFELR